MVKYSLVLKEKVKKLRSQGFTYSEIQLAIGRDIPKSSLNYICRGILLNPSQVSRVNNIMLGKLVENRKKALIANRILLENKISGFRHANTNLAVYMQSRETKLIALSMLYLGEGAKWKGHRGPMLGSSDPNIIQLYINLLRDCYSVPLASFKFRIQHRADQNSEELLAYWSKITGAPRDNFYPSYIDKRTIGKVTKNIGYKGVCVATCAGTHIQLELEQIAGIIFEAV